MSRATISPRSRHVHSSSKMASAKERRIKPVTFDAKFKMPQKRQPSTHELVTQLYKSASDLKQYAKHFFIQLATAKRTLTA